MLQFGAIEMLHATSRFRPDGTPRDPMEPHRAAAKELEWAKRARKTAVFRAKLAVWFRKVSLAGKNWSVRLNHQAS